jgi:hypothetical protein
LPLPFLSISIYLVSNLINRKSEKIQQQLAQLTSTAQEVYSGIRVVKSYAQEDAMSKWFAGQSEIYRKKSLELIQVDAFFFPLMSLLIGASIIITVYVGGLQVVAGNITAGNASQISDGGSAVIVASEAAAERLGVTPLGRILGYGEVAGPDPSLLNQPANAINVALARAGMSVGDLDLFELNEAFAAVGVASMATLGITPEVTNVNGGAIALGHPIGMSGNRVALHLLHELKRRGGGRGAAALCGGGGQGDAILLETI